MAIKPVHQTEDTYYYPAGWYFKDNLDYLRGPWMTEAECAAHIKDYEDWLVKRVERT